MDFTSGVAVTVHTKTLGRDSRDLFDFETEDVHAQIFTTQNSEQFSWNSSLEVVQMSSEDTRVSLPNDKPLLRLVRKPEGFYVDKASSTNKLMISVGEQKHTLHEGDVIKLGCFKFRVRQLVASACTRVHPNLTFHGDAQENTCHVDTSNQVGTCRICLLAGPGDNGDPLITPCQCKGSIKHIHLGCLRRWIHDRMNISQAPARSYYYRGLTCELCKCKYPMEIEAHSKRMPLAKVPEMTGPFLVLENETTTSKGQHTGRGLHVVQIGDKPITLGRSKEADIYIDDVSISRQHATISFEKGQFVLRDNKSKFGTGVFLKRPMWLDARGPTNIQSGRTVFSFSVGSQFDALDTLDVQHNQFTTMPMSFGQPSALQTVDLQSNQYVTMPVNFGQFTILQTLYLQHNQFINLPGNFGQLGVLPSSLH